MVKPVFSSLRGYWVLATVPDLQPSLAHTCDQQTHTRQRDKSNPRVTMCIHTYVAARSQTDRETHNRCLTTNTHADKTDTPHHSLSWRCLLMTITALQHSTSSFHRFLPPNSFMCFSEQVFFFSHQKQMIGSDH